MTKRDATGPSCDHVHWRFGYQVTWALSKADSSFGPEGVRFRESRESWRWYRVSQSSNWYFAKWDGFRSEALCLEKEAVFRRLFRPYWGSVWLYRRSGSFVSVSFINNIAFRKVPIGTLRNETVSGRKRFAWRRRQLVVDCFVCSWVLCGFTVGLVRLFRFYLSISSRFAK